MKEDWEFRDFSQQCLWLNISQYLLWAYSPNGKIFSQIWKWMGKARQCLMIYWEDRLDLLPNLGFPPHIIPRLSQTWRHPGEQSVRPHKRNPALAQPEKTLKQNSVWRLEVFEERQRRRCYGGECDHWGGVGRPAAAAARSRWARCRCHEGHRVGDIFNCASSSTPLLCNIKSVDWQSFGTSVTSRLASLF